MPSLSSHLGGSGASAANKPKQTAAANSDSSAGTFALDNTSDTGSSDAAALSSLHDVKHRHAVARSLSRDVSALTSQPTDVDPDTLPRRKFSGERPPIVARTHLTRTTYDDGDDDDTNTDANANTNANEEVNWRTKKIEVEKIIHADGRVTYPRNPTVEFMGKTVKPDMTKYEHLPPGAPLPPGLKVPGWTHMPEDVMAPPPLPKPEANDPELMKRAPKEVEPTTIPPRPDHPAADPEKRLYRQPDGTLGKKRPPRKPYTVASRREFADLCQYARINGGCDKCTEGVCHRHGTGVLWAEHKAYLAQMGMEPEWDEDGEFYDWDPEKCQPLFDPEHVFCRMMGNDWMDVTKLRQQRHLKHYKGIEFDKESGEFFDFDSVTKEELAEIIEAGGLEVERDDYGEPITDWYKTKEGAKHRPYDPRKDGPRNMFAAEQGGAEEGCLITEGEGAKWGKYAEDGEDFETVLDFKSPSLDRKDTGPIKEDEIYEEVDTGERRE